METELQTNLKMMKFVEREIIYQVIQNGKHWNEHSDAVIEKIQDGDVIIYDGVVQTVPNQEVQQIFSNYLQQGTVLPTVLLSTVVGTIHTYGRVLLPLTGACIGITPYSTVSPIVSRMVSVFVVLRIKVFSNNLICQL